MEMILEMIRKIRLGWSSLIYNSNNSKLLEVKMVITVPEIFVFNTDIVDEIDKNESG